MFIIETIPIAKTIGIKSLSYFTDQEVSIGAIVDIPLRNKIVKGIVISIKPAIDMKSEIPMNVSVSPFVRDERNASTPK